MTEPVNLACIAKLKMKNTLFVTAYYTRIKRSTFSLTMRMTMKHIYLTINEKIAIYSNKII